jgi:uncharacterized membrane protein YebE (DUF533 family)
MSATSPSSVRSILDRLLADGSARAVGDAGRPGMGEAGLGRAGTLGMLAALMGGRRRALSRNALLLGGLGALSKVALDAWSRSGAAKRQPALVELGEDAEAERRATTLLHAMVAAAKADGHVDEEEESAIAAEMEDLPEAARDLMRAALAGTLAPEEIAARVEGGQEAREVYAASALLSGRDHPGEVAHLDRLARALGLSEAEAHEIEAGLATV